MTTKKVGCRDLGIPCDHEEVGDDFDGLIDRLVRHQVQYHGFKDTQYLRIMMRKSVVQFQKIVGR